MFLCKICKDNFKDENGLYSPYEDVVHCISLEFGRGGAFERSQCCYLCSKPNSYYSYKVKPSFEKVLIQYKRDQKIKDVFM